MRRQLLARIPTLSIALVMVTIALPASAVAASPGCGSLSPAEPVQFLSPSALKLKVFVGGCYWDEAERGSTAIVTLSLTGPGYARQLVKVTYPLAPGGPDAAPWVYSNPDPIAVPAAGTYTLTVDEQYPYVAVPVAASSSYTTTVAGATPTPTIAPTPVATPRATATQLVIPTAGATPTRTSGTANLGGTAEPAQDSVASRAPEPASPSSSPAIGSGTPSMGPGGFMVAIAFTVLAGGLISGLAIWRLRGRGRS